MLPADSRILLIDREVYSSGLLAAELEARGHRRVLRVAGAEDPLPEGGEAPDTIVFNHHFQHRNGAEECANARRRFPGVPLVALVSTGPAMREARAWAKELRLVDVIVEKPLSDERFFLVLGDLLAARRAAVEQKIRLERLSRVVPESALRLLEQPLEGDAERFEAAVLFTDIRRSTQIIASWSPEAYFGALNRCLGEQTRLVETFQGTLVKYTGDGLLAVFRGMGRSYLALRAASAIAAGSAQDILGHGVGVASGLVLGGFVGDPERRGMRQQYDVIGATVHLAARLCSLAGPREVIATSALVASARVHDLAFEPMGEPSIRGFERPVPCVVHRAGSSLLATTS